MTRRITAAATLEPSGLEAVFDAAFATELALREKQIQQNYRPVIGIHKWFARRPGTVFRSLLLAEFAAEPLRDSFWKAHQLSGVIGDPFMGGGTPVYEANRLGFHVVGCDINPMAHWIVRQSLAPLDIVAFAADAASVVDDVAADVGSLYKTKCDGCGSAANVKYFLWVKTARCPHCDEMNDLFPGYRLAEAERHPRHVLACSGCGALNEYETPPTREAPGKCTDCGHAVHMEGNVSRKKLECRACNKAFSVGTFAQAPEHRMWALEYHCERCYKGTPGRQFKRPDRQDLARVKDAERRLSREGANLPIPDDEIPAGDESDRLHRWGYRRYREMFGTRQLLGLGILLKRIRCVRDVSVRHALLTVFSDTLRYQNMLCRYDTYALKCQDIFSVHGFPVGLVQCENNLLGIAGIGSGSFRHFVEKYVRAKQYCRAPFETRHSGKKKEIVPIAGETIEASMVAHLPDSRTVKQALLVNAPSQNAPLQANSLDGVFTDPPYFDNVQYAELIDFCFAWLRQALLDEEESFVKKSTRSSDELTGNETLGRGIDHFAAGISEVFQHFAKALKPGGPFVFTYHHNDPTAYLPLVLAILDANLDCTATLPAAAEMTASLHIAGTGSSILDSVFVCRKPLAARRAKARQVEMPLDVSNECRAALAADAAAMRSGGVKITVGDLRCLIAGHVARIAIRTLRPAWNREAPLPERLRTARQCLEQITLMADVSSTVEVVASGGSHARTASSSQREARP
ncbi:MAG: DNA methylase [Myxococcales bacterium]|nr:MAG: DNA methylase [Myxococcales bacterium]